MKNFKVSFLAVGMMLAMAVAFTSCKKSTFEDLNTETAGLMAVNLVPSKSVAVVMSGNMLGYSPLRFNTYTGAYLPVYPGERTVESYDYENSDSLSFTNVNFKAGKYYSAFVLGDTSNFRNVIVEDKLDSLSASNGKAYIRYINAVNGSMSANVTVSSSGSNVIAESASFAKITDFIAVNPGDITVTISEGSAINANRTFSIEQNKVYTIMLISGNTSADPAQVKYIVHGTLKNEGGSSRSSL